MTRKHNHYFKDVSHLKEIDVYRVLELFAVTDPALQHVVKKALCAGLRGAKDFEQDVREIYDTADRRLQMIAEDENKHATDRAPGAGAADQVSAIAGQGDRIFNFRNTQWGAPGGYTITTCKENVSTEGGRSSDGRCRPFFDVGSRRL